MYTSALDVAIKYQALTEMRGPTSVYDLTLRPVLTEDFPLSVESKGPHTTVLPWKRIGSRPGPAL